MEMKHSDGNFTDYFTELIGKGNTQKTDALQVITLSKDLATNKNLDYAQTLSPSTTSASHQQKNH